jgi:RNA-directed DNA polymerase
MAVDYLRYQDDIIILCKTLRQLNRCKRRMMEVLQERGLSLSRKKSRIGCINRGFHFLGVHYLPTRTEDSFKVTHANDKTETLQPNPDNVHSLSDIGGG